MNEKNYLKYIGLLEEQLKVLETLKEDDTIRKEYEERNKVLIRYYKNKIKSLKHEIIIDSVESGVGSGETVENKNLGTSTI